MSKLNAVDATVHVLLSIDVVTIQNDINHPAQLNVSTRALLTRTLLELASQFQGELQSVLGEKYDVRSFTRVNIPGVGQFERDAGPIIGVP